MGWFQVRWLMVKVTVGHGVVHGCSRGVGHSVVHSCGPGLGHDGSWCG